MAEIIGSEEGWREASDPKNPRHAQKQRDIGNLVGKYKAAQDKVKEKFETDMEADYFDAALEVAKRMRGDSQFSFSHIPQKKWDAIWRD
jgi:hypothetical protein